MLEAMFVSAAVGFQIGLELSSLILGEASERNKETKTILFMIEKEINGGGTNPQAQREGSLFKQSEMRSLAGIFCDY